MSRFRWGSWGDPLDMDDTAGFVVLFAAFWLLVGLAHWGWVEPWLSARDVLAATWTSAGEFLLVIAACLLVSAVAALLWGLWLHVFPESGPHRPKEGDRL
jgi:hypothetical protein